MKNLVSLVAPDMSTGSKEDGAVGKHLIDQSINESTGVKDVGPSRREQILAACWKALAEVGFEKITTRRIAEEAGINIATLNYHLGGKEAVLTETLRYAQNIIDEQMRAVVATAKTSRQAVDRAFSMSAKLMRKRPGVLRFDLAVRGFRDENSRQEADKVYGRYCRFVSEILQRHLNEGGTLADGLTPDTLAEYVIAMMDGIVLHYTLFGDEAAADRKITLLRRHVLQLMNLPESQ